MKRMWRTAAAAAWAGISCLAACGGRTERFAASSSNAGSPDAALDSGPLDAALDGDASDAAADAAPDSGAPEGGTCVDIDVSSYDTSCRTDADCIDVTAGTICSGYNCLCGGAAISADGQARYQAALASVTPGPGPYCQCPWLGNARCIQSQCVYCHSPYSTGPNPPGCGDGG